MKKVIALALLVLMILPAVSSCGKDKLTEEQVIEIVGPLIQKSYEINDIFFGEGLPYEKDEDKEAEEEQMGALPPVKYVPVISDKYNSESSLKEAALEVYTESYMESVFDIVFNGMSDGNGNIIQYARYFESFADYLKIRSGVEEESIVCGRKYDVTTLKITAQADNYVFFTLDSFIDGEPAATIELSIKDEGNGWRLDSPTY